ncbi:hypothetical protein ABK040_003625 [Willaertia magna]
MKLLTSPNYKHVDNTLSDNNDIPIASKEIQQYVYKILDYNSHYGETKKPPNLNWSPYGLIGEPTMYPRYKDSQTCYCPSVASGGNEYFIVMFEKPVLVKSLKIYETLGAGAVCKISAVKINSLRSISFKKPYNILNNNYNNNHLNNNNEEEEYNVYLKEKEEQLKEEEEEQQLIEGTLENPLTIEDREINRKILNKLEWITLWKGNKTSGHTTARIFSPTLFTQTSDTSITTTRIEEDNYIFTNIIKIDLDLNNEWSEFDAIKLIGIAFPEMIDDIDGKLKNSYLEIFKKEEYCDISLIHEKSGFEVKAHCGLLASRSLIFKQKIDELMLYCNNNNCRKEIVMNIEDDISFECLKVILEFLYCNSVDITMEEIIPISLFAQKYELNDLLKYCGEVLYISLTYNNIVKFLKKSKELKLTNLYDAILKCMKDNCDLISKKKEIIQELSFEEKRFIENKL